MGEYKLFEHVGANIVGILDDRFDQHIAHFRGIRYASIARRFAAPVPLSRNVQTKLQATEYGPRCPHVPVDVRELMQIPKHLDQYPPDKEDELECLNLNITMPAYTTEKLPVLIWIYGGAQIVSFSTAAHRLCEPGRLVAHATAAGQPMIVVTLNYRLNILAYGLGETDPSSTPNLHIRDLEAGVRWVNDNIASFNGDPSRITLGGESAGSILTHALLLTLPPYIRISRALLCSGSIQSSAPASSSTFTPTIRRIESVSRKFAAQQDLPSASTLTLATTPIPILLSAMAALPLATIPLQHEPSLANWSNHDTAFHRPGLSALMLGDCEFEGVLWLAASRLLTPSSIRATFPGPDPSNATQGLAAAYLDPSPSSPSRGHTNLGISPEAYAALAFLGDHRFSWPNWSIAQSLRSPPAPPATLSASGVKVYQYVFDEPNPWAAAGPQGQGVPRAHHAVDLLGLWGNFDADMPAASTFPAVGSAFRDRVARFVCGGEPWRDGAVFAFGPGGQCAEVAGDDGYQARRRVEAFRLMSDVDRDVVDGVFVRLYRQVAEATRTAMRATGEQQKAGKTVPVVGAKI